MTPPHGPGKSDAVSIRLAVEEDAEAIYGGLIGIADTVDERHLVKSTVDDIRRYGFGGNPAFQALIAEVAGEFAGMCLFFPIFSTWMGRPGVYVQDLYVDPLYRGQAIGEKLLRRTAALCLQEGGAYLSLSVDTGNAAAIRFYERAGIGHADTEQTHKIYGEPFFALADADDSAGDRQS
jgi:ribosomal protein S18 acetylase RimI-like enzyme